MDTTPERKVTLEVINDREFEIVNARGLRIAGVKFNADTHGAVIYTQTTRLRREVAELLGAGLVAYYKAREEQENPPHTVSVDLPTGTAGYSGTLPVTAPEEGEPGE